MDLLAMKQTELCTAQIAYAAWLGALLERHARGRRMLARPRDHAAVEADAASFGVNWRAHVFYGFEDWQRCEPIHHPLLDDLTRRVITAARGWRYEDDFCHEVLSRSPTTPPADIVNQLIDRDSSTVTLLGHLRHDDPVQWRLADLVPEAAQNLAIRRYGNPKYEVHRLEEVLYHFRTWSDVLGCMRSYAPSSADKADLLIKYITAHPDAQQLFMRHKRDHEAYHEAIARRATS